MASVDSLADNTAFARHNRASFPILADPGREVARAYGVLSDGGHARRWTFYIDPDGNVADIDRQVQPAQAGREILRRLRKLGIPRRPPPGD